MTTLNLRGAPVLVVGAGIMGAGIAQVAAQAGHRVLLFDARAGAATQARSKLETTLAGLVSKGKLTAGPAQAALARIEAIAELEQARGVSLAVEAIVEDLDIKRALLRQLEAIVAPGCVLASNTSSISITALANGLLHPGRLVGMHFFNPVPVMKLVEVVSGLHTDRDVADAIFALSQHWGKAPVHARSTPGFIVNRIARPYYAEALALLQEGATSPAVLDACWRGAGFRMGPCELIDLIGHDTNFAVTQSVYQANFGDKRYMPSLLQREMVDGGLLGRKSGRGFYDHREGAAQAEPVPDGDAGRVPAATTLIVHGVGGLASRWLHAFERAGLPFVHQADSHWIGLEADAAQLRQTDGRTATQLSAETGVHDLVVADLSVAGATPLPALAFSPSAAASVSWAQAASGWLRLAGHTPHRVGDAPGLVVARTVAMLINEASDAVHQGVCTAEGADTAMKLGVNYPAGPFEWLAKWNARDVVRLLDHLDRHYRGERYRVSPALRQRAWLPARASEQPQDMT